MLMISFDYWYCSQTKFSFDDSPANIRRNISFFIDTLSGASCKSRKPVAQFISYCVAEISQNSAFFAIIQQVWNLCLFHTRRPRIIFSFVSFSQAKCNDFNLCKAWKTQNRPFSHLQ